MDVSNNVNDNYRSVISDEISTFSSACTDDTWYKLSVRPTKNEF